MCRLFKVNLLGQNRIPEREKEWENILYYLFNWANILSIAPKNYKTRKRKGQKCHISLWTESNVLFRILIMTPIGVTVSKAKSQWLKMKF